MSEVWLAGPLAPEVSAGELDIWRFPLQPTADTDIRILSAHEQARAERFYFAPDRRAYVAAHRATRCILSRYLDVPAPAIVYRYNEHDKPELCQHINPLDLTFNLSHANDWGVLAVTRAQPVGVDIEYQKRQTDILGVAERFFSTPEVDEFSALPPQQKQQGFYNAWTRKEAVIKALGLGLSFPLKHFSVSLTPGQAARMSAIKGSSASDWQLHIPPSLPDYCMAAATYQTPIINLRYFLLEAEGTAL